MRLSSVVLPAPRKPVRTVTGMGASDEVGINVQSERHQCGSVKGGSTFCLPPSPPQFRSAGQGDFAVGQSSRQSLVREAEAGGEAVGEADAVARVASDDQVR